MKKRVLKIATLATAAVALVLVTVFVTVAYLTSSSAVSNTFTVGNVGIHMFESTVDAQGDKQSNDPEINGTMKDSDGNSYHLLPGQSYDKDPTIYVNTSSDMSYLFVKVKNDISTIEYGNRIADDSQKDAAKPTIKEQMAANGWQEFLETTSGMVYIYTGGGEATDAALTEEELQEIANKTREAKKVGGNTTVQEINVFETFSIHEDVENELSIYGGAKVTLTAFAIQSAGFTDESATGGTSAVQKAWDAIVETYPYESGAPISE